MKMYEIQYGSWDVRTLETELKNIKDIIEHYADPANKLEAEYERLIEKADFLEQLIKRKTGGQKTMNMESELKAVCESYGWVYEAAAADFKTFLEYAGIEDEGAAFTEWLDETLHQNGEDAFKPETEKENVFMLLEVDLEGSGFHLAYERAEKRLHLLDLDEPFDITLTNNASNDFFKKVIKLLESRGGIDAAAWPEKIYLYHTDGVVSEWAESRFKYADPNTAPLFGDFMEVMIERKV